MGKLSLMAPWPSIQKLILATGSMNLITLSANGSSSFVGDTVNNTKGKNKITVCVTEILPSFFPSNEYGTRRRTF